MKPRITVITIGVDNLEKSVVFYRDGLSLPTQGSLAQSSSMAPSPFLICKQGSSWQFGPEHLSPTIQVCLRGHPARPSLPSDTTSLPKKKLTL
jgi:catechol 2,3-dioxygenase-like lactoylglutathione lyase family enzyme